MTRLACCLVVLLTASIATAQPRDYLVDVWDTERGLPSSLVASLAQTPQGYLWVATQNGLLRFDGLRFVAFDPDNTPELPHARVEHLFVDAAGTLWINTYDGSITSWRDGVFRREWTGAGPHRFEAFLAVSTADETVFVLDTGALIRRAGASTGPWQVLRPPDTDLVPLFARDAAGGLWIKSIDERLWRLEGGVLREAPARGRVGARVQWLTRDGEGRIWIGTEAEVAVFDGDRFRSMTPLNGEPRLDASLIFFTRDGGHWVIANGRARKARGRQWVWTGDAGKGLTGPFRQSLNGVEDRRGGIWLSDVGKGLLHVRSDGTARWIKVADGLPGNRIRDLFEDREGNIWLAIDRGGLVRLRDSRFQVFTAAEGLRTPAAASVAEDGDGSIWMGSLGGGLQRYRDGVVTRIPFPSDAASGFVFSVFPASNGRLWMSAEHEDLYVFDGTRVSRASPGVHGIKAILVDRAGSVWIGAKDGLSRLDGAAASDLWFRRWVRAPRRARARAGSGRRRVDWVRRRHGLSAQGRTLRGVSSGSKQGEPSDLVDPPGRRRHAVDRHVPRRSAAAARRAIHSLHDRRWASEQRHLSGARRRRGPVVDGFLQRRLPRREGRARNASGAGRPFLSSAMADRTACRRSSARATISRPAGRVATAACGSPRQRAWSRWIRASPRPSVSLRSSWSSRCGSIRR